jgi:hypothetical protein
MGITAALLFEDETVLRLLPNIRRARAKQGEQKPVSISGRNDQRVLFGTINMRTGHRVIIVEKKMQQAGFQHLLGHVRRCYKNRPVYMLLDSATSHTAKKSILLAAKLNITLIWLPKQCSELNAMDHFWRSLKKDISSNYQYPSVDKHAEMAISYIQTLSNKQALIKAGVLSENFWLTAFL